MNTLVILAHPSLNERSIANRIIVDKIRLLPNVTMRTLWLINLYDPIRRLRRRTRRYSQIPVKYTPFLPKENSNIDAAILIMSL